MGFANLVCELASSRSLLPDYIYYIVVALADRRGHLVGGRAECRGRAAHRLDPRLGPDGLAESSGPAFRRADQLPGPAPARGQRAPAFEPASLPAASDSGRQSFSRRRPDAFRYLSTGVTGDAAPAAARGAHGLPAAPPGRARPSSHGGKSRDPARDYRYDGFALGAPSTRYGLGRRAKCSARNLDGRYRLDPAGFVPGLGSPRGRASPAT